MNGSMHKLAKQQSRHARPNYQRRPCANKYCKCLGALWGFKRLLENQETAINVHSIHPNEPGSPAKLHPVHPQQARVAGQAGGTNPGWVGYDGIEPRRTEQTQPGNAARGSLDNAT